jgi:hypothetical protein
MLIKEDGLTTNDHFVCESITLFILVTHIPESSPYTVKFKVRPLF